jgi:allantoicase
MAPAICEPMSDTSSLVDLASERLGGAVVVANDEFFAPKERLILAAPAVFIPDKYNDRGKWMDGWETRRRREPGYDWCILRLGLPGVVRAVVVDTAHFKGNYPESCSVDVAVVNGYPAPSDLETRAVWTTVLDKSPLRGDDQNRFDVREAQATHVRLNIFPDGGVARLRVLGEVRPDWEALGRAGGEVDLAALANGGLVVACSDMFFGGMQNLILPGPSRGMHDGWETRRRRGPGHDWAIVRLGRPGFIRRIEVDTSYYKGNAPGRCSLDMCKVDDDQRRAAVWDEASTADWQPLLRDTPLQPHTPHIFELGAGSRTPATGDVATHVRLNIFPDGGVARLRLYGRIAG